ncbi:DMT family transporter [Alcaligenaceae bacterium C4P045]|nr:DMT family transporter [Alcaligenaceae bacterium C4P045]
MRGKNQLIALGDVMLLAVAVVWGTSYGVVKSALVFYPVLGLLALRFGITFLVVSPTLRHLRHASKATVFGLLGTGILLLGIFLAETYGVLHTRAANAAFLISLCVVLTPLAEWALLKRRPSGLEWTAVALSVLGAALLTGDGEWVFNAGDALILVAALLRALQMCLIKQITATSNLPALTVTAVQTGVVALASTLLLFALVPNPIDALLSMEDAGTFWRYLAYLVLACTLFAFFAQNYAIKRSSPTRVALLMGSEPAFGALFAMVWLNEVISVQGWLGGGLIIAASLLATVRWRSSGKRDLPPATPRASTKDGHARQR